MGITGIAKKAIEKGKQEIKEKVNPFSERNKQQRAIQKGRQKYLKQVETNARREAEIKEAQERGKRRAHEKYNPPQQKTGSRKSGGSSLFATSNLPVFKETASFQPERSMFAPPDPWGNPMSFSGKSSKPKTQAKTTKIVSGGRTIVIKEQAEEQEKKKEKRDNYIFRDPFQF